MKAKLRLYWTLLYTFLKISPITFGGGYAMISIIEREVVKNKLMKEEEIANVFAVAQTLPGAIAVNAATFIGYRVARTVGALFALLGIMLPTLIIVIFASFTYYYFQTNPIVAAAFKGIGAAVIALIVYAGYTIGQTAIKDATTFVIALLSIILLCLLPINPIFFIIAGIVTGIIISKLKTMKREVEKYE